MLSVTREHRTSAYSGSKSKKVIILILAYQGSPRTWALLQSLWTAAWTALHTALFLVLAPCFCVYRCSLSVHLLKRLQSRALPQAMLRFVLCPIEWLRSCVVAERLVRRSPKLCCKALCDGCRSLLLQHFSMVWLCVATHAVHIC